MEMETLDSPLNLLKKQAPLILLCFAGLLISTVHVKNFYYSYDTPKWLIFDLSCIAMVVLFFIKEKLIKIRIGIVGAINGILISLMLFSLIWAPNKTVGLAFIFRFTFAALLIYTLSQKVPKDTLASWACCCISISASGFLIAFIIERYWLKLPFNVGSFSPIGFQNNSGHVFNIWIPVLAYLTVKNIRRLTGVFYLFLCIGLMSILLEAATRGSIVGLLIGEVSIFALLVIKRNRQAIQFLCISGLVVTTIGLTQFSETLKSQRLESKLRSGFLTSHGQRLQMFNNTWTMTVENPLGVGVNNFQYVHPRYAQPGTTQSSPFVNDKQVLTTPHNFVLKIFSELGFIGGLLIIALYGITFLRGCINAYLGDTLDRWLLVALIATFFHSLVSGVFLNAPSLFFSCLLFALIYSRDTTPYFHQSLSSITIKRHYLLSFGVIFYLSLIDTFSRMHGFVGYRKQDIQRLERAVTLNPGNERAWYNLSRVYHNKYHDKKASLHAIQQFTRLYPYHISGLYIEAQRLYQLGQLRDAMLVVNKLKAFYPGYKKIQKLEAQIKHTTLSKRKSR